eukprot:CCRYP_017910-RA/>CCRYP_017910-RA protein AED:0.11 eAED:0.17 QI:0/0/0/1/0/0.33/3/0/709
MARPATPVATSYQSAIETPPIQGTNLDDSYQILTSRQILSRLQSLAQTYPAFVTLTTTQEWFGLERAGQVGDCEFDVDYDGQTTAGCNVYVLVIHDKLAYPDDGDIMPGTSGNGNSSSVNHTSYDTYEQSSGWRYIPDVFLSGAVHGNERVGPTTLVELAELLLEAGHCESLPRNQSTAALAEAFKCRAALKNRGISSSDRRWLARLVATRLIIPTANALGYSRDERREDGIDPNRDFPFDILPGSEELCMQTIAGRSINELFRSHLFPIGLTFHGGMEVIGYEWGAPTYLNKDAPDALAQDTIANAYSRYANGFPHHRAYDYGTMNDKVYYVRGGMEDWAFAGSWDPDRVVQCNPKTYGGYPLEKTLYNNSTLRAFNMLVETSVHKHPSKQTLGNRSQPLDSYSGRDNGHIARNIRLALLAVEVVEPYVIIRGIEGLELEDDDIVPSMNSRFSNGAQYDNTRIIWVPVGTSNEDKFKSIMWTVGGAFDIDYTEILYGLWDALPTNLVNSSDGFYPSNETLKAINSKAFTISLPSHVDAWMYPPGTKLAVFARAKVDSSWRYPPTDNTPVSHIVNARTNPAYYATNSGKIIRGREYNWWYSVPVTLVVGDDFVDGFKHVTTLDRSPRKEVDGRTVAIHVNARLVLPLTHASTSHTRELSRNHILVPIILLFLVTMTSMLPSLRKKMSLRRNDAQSTTHYGSITTIEKLG